MSETKTGRKLGHLILNYPGEGISLSEHLKKIQEFIQLYGEDAVLEFSPNGTEVVSFIIRDETIEEVRKRQKIAAYRIQVYDRIKKETGCL